MGSSESKQLEDEEETEVQSSVYDVKLIGWDEYGNLRYGKSVCYKEILQFFNMFGYCK